MTIVEIARQFLYVREAQAEGQNRGLRVEAVQHWSGGQTGDSWCMEFVWMVLDIFYQGRCPFDRMQSCEAMRQLASAKGWITNNPQPGDLFLYINDQGLAHHVGFVTQAFPLIGLAGNTSEDGISANGDRVAEHGIKATTFVHVPTADELAAAA